MPVGVVGFPLPLVSSALPEQVRAFGERQGPLLVFVPARRRRHQEGPPHSNPYLNTLSETPTITRRIPRPSSVRNKGSRASAVTPCI